jgi:hypothetical protein
MADSLEDKDALTERLEKDREQMAVRVSEVKREYNVAGQLKVSVQKHPTEFIIGAVLIGFLLSRVPARRKEVYVRPDPRARRMREDIPPARLHEKDSSTVNKLWSLAKPIVTTYIGRELYKRVRQSGRPAAEASRASY